MTNAAGESVVFADYSYLSTLAHNPLKAYWAYEHDGTGVVPRAQKSVYLHAGSALHAAVHHAHTTGFADAEATLEVLRESWGAYIPPIGHHLTLGHCEIIVLNYYEDRQHDAIVPLALKSADLNHDVIESFNPEIDANGVVSFAETPMAVWLDDELVYAGLLDLPATIHGNICIVDHKTTGQWLTERWAQQYANSFQLKGYASMLAAVTGEEVQRVYINGIYTGKEAADPKEKWTKRASFRSRLFGPYIVKPHEPEQHRIWAKQWLKAAEFFRGAGFWPLNDKAANDYGGCVYAPLYYASPAILPGILRTKYTPREMTGILASGADS